MHGQLGAHWSFCSETKFLKVWYTQGEGELGGLQVIQSKIFFHQGLGCCKIINYHLFLKEKIITCILGLCFGLTSLTLLNLSQQYITPHEVMRTKEMITFRKSYWLSDKFSLLIP